MTITFDNPPKNGPWTFHPVKRRASRRLHRLVGRCRGPKLPARCRKCEYYDPTAEAYACCACHVTLKRDHIVDANKMVKANNALRRGEAVASKGSLAEESKGE